MRIPLQSARLTLSLAAWGLFMPSLEAVDITVTGTVSDPTATVSVNGTAATVDPPQQTYMARVTLTPGPNTLTATATNRAGEQRSVSVNVVLDVTLPQVAFDPANTTSAPEFLPLVPLVVVMDRASSDPVTVPYSVSGTATFGSDHVLANGTLTFDPWSLAEVMNLTIIDDSLMESSETVVVTLGTPANATLGNPASHTYTILDNDTGSSTTGGTTGGATGGF